MRFAAIVLAGALAWLWFAVRDPAVEAPAPVVGQRRADLVPLARQLARTADDRARSRAAPVDEDLPTDGDEGARPLVPDVRAHDERSFVPDEPDGPDLGARVRVERVRVESEALDVALDWLAELPSAHRHIDVLPVDDERRDDLSPTDGPRDDLSANDGPRDDLSANDGPRDDLSPTDEPRDDARRAARDAAELAAWNRPPAPGSLDLSDNPAYLEVIEIVNHALPIDTTPSVIGSPPMADPEALAPIPFPAHP